MTTRRLWLALVLSATLALAGLMSLHAADKPGDKKTDKAKAAEKDDKDDAKPEAKDRYQLPPGGVKELLAFIKEIREFQPGSQEEALEHREKAIPAIKAAAEKILKTAKEDDEKLEGFDEVPGLLLALRATEVAEAPPEAQKKLIHDIKAYIESRGKLKRQDLSAALQVASALEYGSNPELAVDAYRELGEALAKSKDEQASRVGARMVSAARRLTLIGNPLQLAGTEIDGAKFDWAKYRGKVVLVDFWATWCGPCRAELPNVKKNYKLYHDRGFEVVGISLDDDREALEQYLEKEPNPWITLHDGGWDANSTAAYYGIMGIPTVILVDKQGKVVSTNARGPELGKLLAELLGPAKPDDDSDTAADK